MKFLGAQEKIPFGTWRLGVFAMPSSAVIGLSESDVRNGIIYRVTRGGMDISAMSLAPMSVWVSVYGEAAQCWAALVRNQVQGLTTTMFYQRSSLPAQFSADASEEDIQNYLDVFQGTFAGNVYLAKPQIWSTPNSILRVGVWYSTAAVWKKGDVPSAAVLEQRLKASGYDMWSHQTGVVPFYYEGQPNGLIFMVYTGTRTTTPAEIAKVIGADQVLVNLAAPVDEPWIGQVDKLAEVGDETLTSLSDLGAGLGEATTGISKGTGTVVDVLGFVGKYFLPIVVIGGAGYLYYRHRRKKGYQSAYGEFDE